MRTGLTDLLQLRHTPEPTSEPQGTHRIAQSKRRHIRLGLRGDGEQNEARVRMAVALRRVALRLMRIPPVTRAIPSSTSFGQIDRRVFAADVWLR